MLMDERFWYAVYTHANAEKKLYQRICDCQLEAYLPLHCVYRKWSDRQKKQWLPLFKSYLFVYADLAEMHRIKCLNGFSHYISFGGYPLRIQLSEITLMKLVVDLHKEVSVMTKGLVKGEKVNIIKGVLSGYQGVLTADQDRKKIAISIKHIDQTLLIEVPLDYVAKV